MKKKVEKCIFYIWQGLYLILIEIYNQLLIKKTVEIQLDVLKITVVFDLLWALFIFISLYALKPKIRKITTTIFNFILLAVSIANYFIYCYFELVFSWKDLFLAGSGIRFLSSIFKFINLKLIIFTLISLVLIVIIYKCKYPEYKLSLKKKLIVITTLIMLIIVRVLVQTTYLSKITDGWDARDVNYNYQNNYREWIDSPKLLRMSGIYEYLVRDFYFSFLKSNNAVSTKKAAEKYLKENQDKNATNEYTGIYKDKNLIFIMMESMDDWMVNEEVTPTIYEMQQHGFNFVNHYSPVYVTGATANTEFIANTGMYPNINKLSPNYAYVKNEFPYSLPNLFKANDYIVNSYHRSSSFIYNRGNMHISLGYTKYYDYSDMGIAEKNSTLDSYVIIDGYDKIVNKDNKFMSFIITYSPHSPYTTSKEECSLHLDEIKKIYPDEKDEEILCGYASARETDDMFKVLLEKLAEDNLLDDTIIVAFADHPNKVVIRDDETSKANKTIFYIYDKNMSSNQIEAITSSLNILPTVVNLFDINDGYIYPGYDALDYQNGYVVFDDYTYYDGKEIKKTTDEMNAEINYSVGILASNYYHNK